MLKWIPLPEENPALGVTAFGVEVVDHGVRQLHGGFATAEEADAYAGSLVQESHQVQRLVAIETRRISSPGASHV